MNPTKPTQVKKEVRLDRFHRLRHPYMVPVITFLVLFFATMIVFIAKSGTTIGAGDSRVVELSIDGGQQQIIPTTAQTVGDLLKRLNITLNPGDIVEPDQNTAILQNNFQINVYREHSVTVVENNQKQVILTASNDPRVIAQQAGFTIYPEDYVTPTTDATSIDENVLGEEITVDPATPVSLNLYGSQVTVRTHATTVAELLSDEKIKTSTGNNVLPATSTPVTANMQVIVVPVGQQLISTQEPVPFTSQTVYDPSAPFGTSVVTQAGVNGLALAVYSVSGTGAAATRSLIQQVTITPPTPEIISKGIGIQAVDGGDNITWLKDSNIDPGSYADADYIITHESNWNPDDVSHSGCVGLGQSCGYPSGLSVVCPDWQVDAVCQLNFFNNYALSRYGGWAGAQIHWSDNGWW
ncbi:MAG TPA: ubiquitin-like domain-containing protein [Candidatus Saccharimonadales bacterium]|nr:ubiquitin-like domain-containing protein [Candidatus Saccharimonadales bacterium]